METGQLETLVREAEGRLTVPQMLEILTRIIELRCFIKPIF